MDRDDFAEWLSGFEGEVVPPPEVIGVLEELAFAHANIEADWASVAGACGLDIAIAAAKNDVGAILRCIAWLASCLNGTAQNSEQEYALSGILDLTAPWMNLLPAAGELGQAVADAATSTHH